MTDKQDANSDRFPLPGWQVAEARGRDAAAFLHAQTMNDVRALEPGHWQWNGWLNSKGRLIALFALAALDAETCLLIVPDVPAAELVQRLQHYVFRSKVALRVRDDCRAFGAFAAPARANGSRFEPASPGPSEGIELDLGGAGGARGLSIEAFDPAGDPGTPAAADTLRWDAFDLAHGLPRLPIAQSERWTPQMLSLERLRAFSLKKGCYPGQEIVARTHFLGQAKRTLARIAGDGIAADAEIVADGLTIGSVIGTAGGEALAVLAADRKDDDWRCAGNPCRELPLLDGLAR